MVGSCPIGRYPQGRCLRGSCLRRGCSGFSSSEKCDFQGNICSHAGFQTVLKQNGFNIYYLKIIETTFAINVNSSYLSLELEE